MKRKLTEMAARAVRERGVATLDDIQPMFPDHTRAQVQKALENAKAKGWVRLVRRGRGGPGKRDGGLWGEGEESAPQIQPDTCIRPPNSAWELGHCRQHPGSWPLPGAGTKYQPLGGWVEANDNGRRAA